MNTDDPGHSGARSFDLSAQTRPLVGEKVFKWRCFTLVASTESCEVRRLFKTEFWLYNLGVIRYREPPDSFTADGTDFRHDGYQFSIAAFHIEGPPAVVIDFYLYSRLFGEGV